jgi:hypothetical protein
MKGSNSVHTVQTSMPTRSVSPGTVTLNIMKAGILNLPSQWYSTFFVRVPPDIIYLQLCTPKVVGV